MVSSFKNIFHPKQTPIRQAWACGRTTYRKLSTTPSRQHLLLIAQSSAHHALFFRAVFRLVCLPICLRSARTLPTLSGLLCARPLSGGLVVCRRFGKKKKAVSPIADWPISHQSQSLSRKKKKNFPAAGGALNFCARRWESVGGGKRRSACS